MKNSVRGLATRITVLAVSCSLASFSGGSETWYNNYEEALAAAQREGKPIFADFSTTWCHNCKQLERETLSDPNISARLDNFIKVHIDGDQRADVVQQFGVDAYPTLVTMDPSGRMVDKSIGFVRAPQLAGTLDSQMQTLAPTLQRLHASREAKKSKDASAKDASAKVLADAKKHPTANSALPPTTTEANADGRNPLFRNTNGKANADESLSKPVLGSTALADATGRNAKPDSMLKSDVADKAQDHPLSKAEARFQSQQGSRSVYANGDQPAMAGSTNAGRTVASVPATKEISPLLGSTRAGSPGGGASRSKDDELVVSQAEPRKTPASAVASEAGTDDELPRPLLNTGTKTKTDAGAKATSAKTTVKSEAAPAVPVATETAVESKKSTAKAAPVADKSTDEDDPMATIRKLQKSSKAAKGGEAASAETASKKSESPAATDTKSKSTEAKATADTAATAAKKTKQSPTTGEEPAATDSKTKSETASDTEPAGEAKSTEVTEADVTRWVKDADSQLIAGHKREARAMYQKVYEKDPKNAFGKSDMAFIKMVSLMVDQDDDALRQKALNKIKQFEALFPTSEHKDYYTLIRATLAADLGDTNGAHRLLETYADRFPDSKYQKLAFETWKSLPPVKKESTKVASSKDSGSKKPVDKKKKSEE